MRRNQARPCTCGHAKSIHGRMYGRVYANTQRPRTCNFPGCKCKQYTPAKEEREG